MNRRNFITSIGALVGGLALDKAIPFNRVWSFPSKIVIPKKIYSHQTYALGTRISWELLDDWEESVEKLGIDRDSYSVIHSPLLFDQNFSIIVPGNKKTNNYVGSFALSNV